MQREQSGSIDADRKVVARQKEDEQPFQMKAENECCQRQPEAPKEDDEKKKVSRMMDQTGIARQADEERAPAE